MLLVSVTAWRWQFRNANDQQLVSRPASNRPLVVVDSLLEVLASAGRSDLEMFNLKTKPRDIRELVILNTTEPHLKLDYECHDRKRLKSTRRIQQTPRLAHLACPEFGAGRSSEKGLRLVVILGVGVGDTLHGQRKQCEHKHQMNQIYRSVNSCPVLVVIVQ